ncbi:hypothetical protein TWF281_006220 [Arthrobotrys megalospora]
MASNYYGYNHGNSSYPQNQQPSFQDQYPSTAPAPTAQQTASQSYYQGSQTQPRQAASAVRQTATDNRPAATTQYNGLHFPAPAPAKQSRATTSHSGGSTGNAVANTGGAAGSNAPNVGNTAGYGSGGLYQASNKSSGSHTRQRTDASAGRSHDRAEHALSASTGWNTGATTSSAVRATSQVVDTSYGYSYNKPDTVSQQQQQQQQQQNYYQTQRTSATPSTAQTSLLNSGYDQTPSYTSSSAPQPSSTASKPLSQVYRQPAQSSSTASYGHSYETPSAKTNASNTTPTYQQPVDYGKTYHDDADQSQSYLHRVYTLPQPTPTRNGADSSGSYFSNNHATEPSYATSSQTSKPNTVAQTTPYDRTAQDLGRGSSTATSASSYSYNSSATAPTQSTQAQYYQDYAAANVVQLQATPYNDGSASTTSTTQAASAPAPVPVQQPVETPAPPAKKARKPRQSASQKSPTANTPKPRALRKSKASATAAAASPVNQQPASLPPQHTFYPADFKSDKPATNASAIRSTAMKVDPPPERSLSPSSGTGVDMQTMEQHMREMVEKMREYQSRDPTAFQQVWENVKRANPSAAGGKGGAPLPSTSSKNTGGVDSPRQKIANLAKPATSQQAPAEAGRQTPGLGNAASQAQKTVWPATQKVALSQTTSRFLTGLGQACTELYITGILDYGPTFPELCDKLESQGYKFERNKLATELLKTSESVDSTRASASTAAPAISAAKPATDIPPRTMTPQSMKSFNPRNIKDSITSFVPQDHNHHDHSQNFVAPSMIYREVSYPTHFGQPESNVRSDEPSALPTPAAAQASSPQPIPEKPAKGTSKKRVSMANISHQPPLQAPQTPRTPQAMIVSAQPQAPVAPQPSFPPALREEPMPDASPASMVIPISRYESLIQASSPFSPYVTSQPKEDTSALEKLQSKLEAQMSRLKELEEPLELPAQLASVPSQPAPLPPPLPPPPTSRKVSLLRPLPLDKKKALRRNTYDERMVVHAVLQSTGRNPQYEGLNSRLTMLKRLHPDTFDNTTDIAEIPWDVYDPPPAPLPGETRKVKRSIVPDELEERGRKREPVPFTTGVPRTEPDPSIPTFTEGKIRGKRGRPRGSRGVPRGTRGGRGGRGGATAGGTVETPNTDPNSAGDTSTTANAHKYGTVTRVNINTLRNGGGGGDSSRKRKYGDSPDPRYPGDGSSGGWGNGLSQTVAPVFKCQWEKCNHELQNLETLRRHLIKKHRVENTQGVLPCCWGKCGNLIPIGRLDPETGAQVFEQRRRRFNFGTGAQWENHVLGEHLRVVREELGEGMSVSVARSLSRGSSAHSVEGRLRSMSRDRTGRSVTPVITQAPHGYKFTPPPGFSAGSQFRLAHEFPQPVEIDSDVDEETLLEEELARLERMGAGAECLHLSNFPGLEFDSGEGWTAKLRKLTSDLSQIAPVAPVAPAPIRASAEGDDENREKGKVRADD